MYDYDKRLPNIVITGTPGVGKTSLAMLLTDNINEQIEGNKKYTYINVGKLILDKKLYDNWNQEFDVPEFNEDKTLDELEPLLKDGGAIIDFHSAYFLPEDLVDIVVLLRCNNTILYDRLKARGYQERKIKENIECEIMEVTADDVKENFKQEIILELPNEKVEDMGKNIEAIIERAKQLIQ